MIRPSAVDPATMARSCRRQCVHRSDWSSQMVGIAGRGPQMTATSHLLGLTGVPMQNGERFVENFRGQGSSTPPHAPDRWPQNSCLAANV